MSASETTSDVQQTRVILQRLLRGASLTGVCYLAGFKIELARSGKPPFPNAPMAMWLTLFSDWFVRDIPSWPKLAGTVRVPGLESEALEPVQSFVLLSLNGAQVMGASLNDAGQLTLEFDKGHSLIVPGEDDVFENSWILDIPRDVPGAEEWSVTCSSHGEP